MHACNWLANANMRVLIVVAFLYRKVFDLLEHEIENNIRYEGSFQLTPSLDKLCTEGGLLGK